MPPEEPVLRSSLAEDGLLESILKILFAKRAVVKIHLANAGSFKKLGYKTLGVWKSVQGTLASEQFTRQTGSLNSLQDRLNSSQDRL